MLQSTGQTQTKKACRQAFTVLVYRQHDTAGSIAVDYYRNGSKVNPRHVVPVPTGPPLKAPTPLPSCSLLLGVARGSTSWLCDVDGRGRFGHNMPAAGRDQCPQPERQVQLHNMPAPTLYCAQSATAESTSCVSIVAGPTIQQDLKSLPSGTGMRGTQDTRAYTPPS